MSPYAFISYQTADKIVAREIKSLLEKIGISSFLAHEDIAVSEERGKHRCQVSTHDIVTGGDLTPSSP